MLLSLEVVSVKGYLTIIPRARIGYLTIRPVASWATDPWPLRAKGLIVLVSPN